MKSERLISFPLPPRPQEYEKPVKRSFILLFPGSLAGAIEYRDFTCAFLLVPCISFYKGSVTSATLRLVKRLLPAKSETGKSPTKHVEEGGRGGGRGGDGARRTRKKQICIDINQKGKRMENPKAHPHALPSSLTEALAPSFNPPILFQRVRIVVTPSVIVVTTYVPTVRQLSHHDSGPIPKSIDTETRQPETFAELGSPKISLR